MSKQWQHIQLDKKNRTQIEEFFTVELHYKLELQEIEWVNDEGAMARNESPGEMKAK